MTSPTVFDAIEHKPSKQAGRTEGGSYHASIGSLRAFITVLGWRTTPFWPITFCAASASLSGGPTALVAGVSCGGLTTLDWLRVAGQLQ